MKVLRIFVILTAILFLSSSYLQAASENVAQLPDTKLYTADIQQYAQTKFSGKIPLSGLSDKEISQAAEEAGWSAFCQNFGLQGAAFTFFEECLGAAFLSNINSACGEIGGVFVLMQLVMDLGKKDYKAANINFAKGSIGYAIGKWGSKALKVGMIASVAVEWYLTSIATTVNRIHDDYYYDALRYYFARGPGKKTVKEWIDIFTKANNGQGVSSTEEVLEIVDEHVDSLWKPENFSDFYLMISEMKDTAGQLYQRGETPRLKAHKQHFKDYVKSIVVLPYLKPVLNHLAKKAQEQEAKRILQKFVDLAQELNKVYTIQGLVKGPQEKVKGLKVVIPEFLDTRTDDKGRFTLKFTLYALLSSGISFPLKIELLKPTSKKAYVKIASKNVKIQEKHRKTGIIRGSFKLAESDKLRIIMDNIKDPFKKWKIEGFLAVSIDEATNQASIERNYTALQNRGERKSIKVQHTGTVSGRILKNLKLKDGKTFFNICSSSLLAKERGGLLTLNITIDHKQATIEGNYGVYLKYQTCNLQVNGRLKK